MRACCLTGKAGVCGGVLAVLLVLTGLFCRPSEAQDRKPEDPAFHLVPSAPTPPQVAPPAAAAQAAPAPQTVEQLTAVLTDIRAKKAELDRREKETIAALKQRFRQQRQVLAEQAQKLRELGVEVLEEAPP